MSKQKFIGVGAVIGLGFGILIWAQESGNYMLAELFGAGLPVALFGTALIAVGAAFIRKKQMKSVSSLVIAITAVGTYSLSYADIYKCTINGEVFFSASKCGHDAVKINTDPNQNVVPHSPFGDHTSTRSMGQIATSADVIQLPGCQFSVKIPNARPIEVLRNEDYAYHQVRGRLGQVFFQAECVQGIMDGEETYLSAKTHIKAIAGRGMQFKQIHPNVFENRFVKDIRGIPTTYVVRYYLGNRSTLMIVSGTESKNYPHEEIFQFFRSVKYRE